MTRPWFYGTTRHRVRTIKRDDYQVATLNESMNWPNVEQQEKLTIFLVDEPLCNHTAILHDALEILYHRWASDFTLCS